MTRIKLLGFLVAFLLCVHGNAQPPIEWHVDYDSAFMHFPMRDSVKSVIIQLMVEQELESRRLYEEYRERFPQVSCIATEADMLKNRPDTLELQRLQEIKELEREADKILFAKSEELNTLVLSSFQSQFEAFSKQHPEKTIVFEPGNRDSPDWFDLTAQFILFLEEKH